MWLDGHGQNIKSRSGRVWKEVWYGDERKINYTLKMLGDWILSGCS